MIALAVLLLSSCSVTKMRYSRGLNINMEIGKGRHMQTAPVNVAKMSKKHQQSEITLPTTANSIEPSIAAISPSIPCKININQEQPTSLAVTPKIKTVRAKASTAPDIKISTDAAPIDPSHYTPAEEPMKSGVWAIVGFICSLLGLAPLGLIFCAIGMGRNRRYRGLAIAGFVISLIVLLALLAVI